MLPLRTTDGRVCWTFLDDFLPLHVNLQWSQNEIKKKKRWEVGYKQCLMREIFLHRDFVWRWKEMQWELLHGGTLWIFIYLFLNYKSKITQMIKVIIGIQWRKHGNTVDNVKSKHLVLSSGLTPSPGEPHFNNCYFEPFGRRRPHLWQVSELLTDGLHSLCPESARWRTECTAPPPSPLHLLNPLVLFSLWAHSRPRL